MRSVETTNLELKDFYMNCFVKLTILAVTEREQNENFTVL